MASKALLIWCAGSAVVCGTAALATTSLWRAPTPGVDSIAVSPPADVTIEIALPEEPAELTGFDAASESAGAQAALPPLSGIAFFSPSAEGASNLFRPSLPPEAAEPAAASEPGPEGVPAPAQPPARPDFAEILTEDLASRDPRLAVRPPPRPSFTLARLDAAAKPLAEVQPAQPAPGFAEQPAPGWSFGDAFRAPAVAARPARVIHAGVASWYGPGFHGRKTASGERFNQNDLTAAHRTLPFGTRVKVVDERTGRSVVVRINDRGPFAHGRVIDLSKAASQALGMGGLARVKLVAATD